MATIKDVATIGGGATLGAFGSLGARGVLQSQGVPGRSAVVLGTAAIASVGLLLAADGVFRPRSSFASEKFGVGAGMVVGAGLTTIRI